MSLLRFRSMYHVAPDFQASFDFYSQGLGFPIKFRDESNWAEFHLGEVRFALSSTSEAAKADLQAVAVFQTDSRKELEKAVVRYGGRIMGWRDMGTHGMVATVRDPGGVIFQVLS